MFFDKKCTITKVSIVLNGNKQEKQRDIVYENIPCDFYPPTSNGYVPSDQAKEYSTAKYEVVLQWQYNEVRQGMEIELIDLGSQGIFIIDSLLANRKANGTIDNITLQVKLRNAWPN